MQFMAAYDQPRNTGLYVAAHDPLASAKNLLVESQPRERRVVLSFPHPAEEMDRPGNDFRLAGEAVWRIVRGDWFDAAMVYRDWVRSSARWWPKLGPDGRADKLVGLHAGIECHFLFDPTEGHLLAVEMFADDESDPCEVIFSDFQERDSDGRFQPHRMEVRHQDGVYGIFQLESIQASQAAEE